MLAIICMVLFIWSMFDWYSAAMKNSWLWVVVPFSWLLLMVGAGFLAGPATFAVVDRPLPVYGNIYIFPAAVLVAGIGMVLNHLSFWGWCWRVMWSRSRIR